MFIMGGVNAAAAAVNVAVYADGGNPINLGAAVFSALFAIGCWLVAAS